MTTRLLSFVATLSIMACAYSQGGFAGGGNVSLSIGANDATLQKRVSLNRSFTLSEFTEWLKEQKVSFVYSARPGVPSSTVVVNIQDKPLRDVMVSVAYSLGATWSQIGEIYTLVGPQVIISNGVVMTTNGEVIQGPSRLEPQKAQGQTIMKAIAPLEGRKPRQVPLSEPQRRIASKRGYLKLSELSKYQKGILGNSIPKNGDLIISCRGADVVVKLEI